MNPVELGAGSVISSAASPIPLLLLDHVQLFTSLLVGAFGVLVFSSIVEGFVFGADMLLLLRRLNMVILMIAMH